MPRADTKGDYSPGVVMGNYTVNTALDPTPVGLLDAFKISIAFRPSERGYFIDLDGEQTAFVNGCILDPQTTTR